MHILASIHINTVDLAKNVFTCEQLGREGGQNDREQAVIRLMHFIICRERQEYTKPVVSHRAVFVRRLTTFSQCVPHRRLKLVLVAFFSADSTSASELDHLIILIGCSATATCWFRKAFHLMQAQN
ncbi:hypothetical protein DPX16_21113 [Anabarilius grahami]|uniref:Uncharacterized protein n=1 Tax=Anabarilius grahami TaxID=495550 RepID=A0A3N0Z9Q5_ANAGA|nr:hypothetical protein DPX16_21113 [Anabarilius grahami]